MPSNKKRRLKMERQQHRPEFDTVLRSKKIWNRLRERKVHRIVLTFCPNLSPFRHEP